LKAWIYSEFGGLRTPDDGTRRATLSGFGLHSGDARHIGDRPRLPHSVLMVAPRVTSYEPRKTGHTRKNGVDWSKGDPLLGLAMGDQGVADILGCALSTVARRRRSLGIEPMPFNLRPPVQRNPEGGVQWSTVGDLWSTWYDHEIAERLGCTTSAVCRYRNRYNIKGLSGVKRGERD
jgi:hypothetical protein